MIWAPRYQFLSMRPFRDNVQREFDRNFAAALFLASPTADPPLPGLQGIYNTRGVRDKWPIANLLTLGGDSELLDGGDYDESKRLLIEIETLAEDDQDLIEVLEPYVLAARTVVASMSPGSLLRGISGSRDEVVVAVGSERYGEREYETEGLFTRVGSVIATFSYREVEVEAES